MRKGFTLIELMVTLAVVGLLSAVIFASLTASRNRGKDTAIKSAAKEMRTMLELEFNDTGSYAGLLAGSPGGWITPATAGSTCNDTPFPLALTSSYVTKFREVCRSMFASMPATCHALGCLYIGPGTATASTTYSMMAWLPSKNAFYCISSKGRTSETSTGAGNNWPSNGCFHNP